MVIPGRTRILFPARLLVSGVVVHMQIGEWQPQLGLHSVRTKPVRGGVALGCGVRFALRI